MTDSIEEVIARLEAIVAETRAAEERAGYFAAMYLSVTREIKTAIAAGKFEDRARMERFDVVFAHRYIAAYDQWRAGELPSAAWQLSFEGATKRRPIIVQQLLTGMNAHINLDLGIAAATIAPGAELAGLQADFNKINEVLAGMTAGFMRDVEAVSPWIKFLDRIGGRTEKHVIKFSIDVARDEAWKLATELAPLPTGEWPAVIEERDGVAAVLGHVILHPGWLLSLGLGCIRARESNNIKKVIDLFESTA